MSKGGRILFFALMLLAMFESTAQPRKLKIDQLVNYIDSARTPLVINFWATYCRPCLQEIPYMEMLTATHKADSVTLLLVSLDAPEDYPAALSAFISKRGITGNVAWLDETNADYFCPKIDKAWSGALPATLFVNNRTGYRKFFEKAFTLPQLTAQYAEMLAR